jgi:hypothetical protein
MPHRPYIVDASCRRRAEPVPWSVPFGSPVDKEAYVAQLHCTNRLVLDAVSGILARSPTPPIIILQGDHGTMSLQPFAHPERPPPSEAVRERHGAFGAYHLPYGGADAMPDSVTLVNVLRVVFAYYLGADLAPLPDDVYFSYERTPYRFFPVSASWVVGDPLEPEKAPVRRVAHEPGPR